MDRIDGATRGHGEDLHLPAQRCAPWFRARPRAAPLLRLVVIFATGFAVSTIGALAADPLVPACGTPTTEAFAVAEILGAITLRLADGRTVRMRGLMPPSEIRLNAPPDPRARAHLAKVIAGRSVRLLAEGATPDRYGRIHAHLVRADDGLWLDGHQLAAGNAAIGVEPGETTPCRADLERLEHDARTAGFGLWQTLTIRSADAPSLAEAAPGFAIVEGRILSVGETRSTIYLNFGRKWREDFTITIYQRNLKRFVAAGLDPRALKGARIRIRGWLERHDGALISAQWPGQIVRLD